jgi:hypothetical protein
VRRRLTVGLVALALPAAALADSRSVRDPNDTRGKVDVSSVLGAHNRIEDRLVHVVHTYEGFGPADLLNRSGPPGSICVNVWTTRTPGDAMPNYEVCATSNRQGTAFRGDIDRFGRGGSVRRIGAARVEHPAADRLLIRFDPDRIRRPGSYRWNVQAATFGSGCRTPTGCEDLAPNTPRTIRTRLGTPR